LIIRDALPDDLVAMTAIYNDAVEYTTSTFDLEARTLADRRAWFDEHGGRFPLIVAEVDGHVAGYCSLSRFRPKHGYDATLESSVYVAEADRGRGVATALMQEALGRARAIGCHAVVAAVAGGNAASVRLHRHLGFRPVGVLREVGRKFGRWQDVHLYELLLDRQEDP